MGEGRAAGRSGSGKGRVAAGCRRPDGGTALARLEDLPWVGPSVAAKLRTIGILEPADLIGRDPYALYEELNARTGRHHDPCLLDVFIAVTRSMAGGPSRPWWEYTAERKARLAAAAEPGGRVRKAQG